MTITDPVCGMQVDEKQSELSIQQGSHTYYLCSARCLDKFKADPQKYAGMPTAHSPHTHKTGTAESLIVTTSDRKELAKDSICGVMVNKATAAFVVPARRFYSLPDRESCRVPVSDESR